MIFRIMGMNIKYNQAPNIKLHFILKSKTTKFKIPVVDYHGVITIEGMGSAQLSLIISWVCNVSIV